MESLFERLERIIVGEFDIEPSVDTDDPIQTRTRDGAPVSRWVTAHGGVASQYVNTYADEAGDVRSMLVVRLTCVDADQVEVDVEVSDTESDEPPESTTTTLVSSHEELEAFVERVLRPACARANELALGEEDTEDEA